MKKTLGMFLYINGFLACVASIALTMTSFFRDGNVGMGFLGLLCLNVSIFAAWAGLRLCNGKNWLTGE